jgi:HlyD family secretion protein
MHEPGPDVHVVDSGTVQRTLKESGVVQPRQTVVVKSKVSGRVREVLVAEGDRVASGQLVAVVEPDAQAALTLSQKRLEVRRLAIEMEQDERDHRRQSRLLEEGLVAPQLAEQAEKDFRTAESLFLQARTALNLLEREANQPQTRRFDGNSVETARLTDYRILAPIHGIVTVVHVRPGELATSGTTGLSQEGALLMELADQSQLEVRVEINEIDIGLIRVGMAARITLAAWPDEALTAHVDRVAVVPQVSENKLVVFPVVLRLNKPPPELRQGLTAKVDLTLERVDDAVRIPLLAYSEQGGKCLVKLDDGGEGLVEREVRLGLKGDRFAVVEAGLEPKDVIAARYPRDEG